MSAITDIYAREVLDSRGNPTILKLKFAELGGFGRPESFLQELQLSVNEAVELRDGKGRFLGKETLKAVENVNKVIQGQVGWYGCY